MRIKQTFEFYRGMTEAQVTLIRAAEVEFAERGFAGASVRAITARAGMNVAAVNYHFGSKAALFREMIRYRIEPINRLRLQQLDAASERAMGSSLPLGQLVEILVRPIFESLLEQEEQGLAFMRAIGRGLMEEEQLMEDMHEAVLAEMIERFGRAIGQSLGRSENTGLGMHFLHFVTSTLLGVMNQVGRGSFGNQEGFNPESVRAFVDRLVAYMAGGIRALDQFERESERLAPQ